VIKTLLAKIALHKAIGLYLGDQEIAVSEVAATPLGPVETASYTEPCTPETAEEVLRRLTKPLLSGKRRLPVAVGLPNSRIFFGTRLTRSGGDVSPEAVLQKAFSSPNIRIDDLTIDLLRGDVNKMPVASVAACRKKYMHGVIGQLTQLGVRPHNAEPDPCAMVRCAAQLHRFPRRSKTVLCIFLNEKHGLAVLIAGGLTLAWRHFFLTEDSENLAILSAARTLQTQIKHYGIESAADFAMIFGREDIHERLRKEQLPSDLGTRVIWHDGPALGGPAIAFGLALSCLGTAEEGFDLSRELKPRPSISEIFPWADLAFTAFLVVCMGVVLGFHTMRLNEMYATVKVESSQYTSLGAGEVDKLEKNQKDMQLKVEAVRSFVESRIGWTAFTHEIGDKLPDNARLMTFQAANDLEAGRGGRKTLLFRATAPLSEDGSVPREIDVFLSELRRNKLLNRDFPSIEIADIKRSESTDKDKPSVAAFNIVCLPKKK
jgi:hypothetical protein